MPDQYTHNFEFKVGDGGKFLEGEIEFNTDGRVSYRFSSISEPIQLDVLRDFIDLTELLKRIFVSMDGIKKIEFTEKQP